MGRLTTRTGTAPTRADAEALDAADPLAPFRERFVFTGADERRIYLDGNSLGRQPVAARDAIAQHAEEWAQRLVSGWPDWIDAPRSAGDALARGVLGAEPGQVLVCDSVTVNLFKLAGAALQARPDARAIVTTKTEFPTDRYVLDGLAAQRGIELRQIDRATPEAIADAGASGDVALVCLSHVDYRSGERADLPAIADAAHAGGALALFDLSHSAGAVPIDLDASGADLAVGCTYKHVNAGPGAPAFLYVRAELIDRLRSPIQGWFGQRDQFQMDRPYDPAPAIERFLAGTPPIGGVRAVQAGAELIEEAGVERIDAKGRALTEHLVALHDAWLQPLGFEVASPREPERRGAHVALRHRDAWRVCRALIDHAAVVPDFRPPDLVRFGISPLYTRFVDVHDAMARLRDLVALKVHESIDATPDRVT